MVPVVEDDGVVVWESNTIIRHLAASRGRHDLLPADAAQRAQVEKWMDWQGSDFNNSWRGASQDLVRKNPVCQDPAAIEHSLAAFSHVVAIVDARLGKSGGHIAVPFSPSRTFPSAFPSIAGACFLPEDGASR